MRVCEFKECGRPHNSHGLCRNHADQRRRGSALRPIRAISPKSVSTVRDEHGRKRCVRCNAWQEESEFYSLLQTSDRLNSHCKSCMKWGNLLRLFGLTPERFAEMLAEQGGGCAICLVRPEENGKRFAVDHDRLCCPSDKSCGQCIRGVLCSGCNAGIGFLRESRDIMQAAIRYLEAHQ